MRWLRSFSLLTAAGLYLIVLMGALVTKTGSEDGCGNTWPFCNGEVLPSYVTVETVIEYSHRIVSAAVGLMVLIVAAWAWRSFRDDGNVRFLAFNAVFFVVFQGLLGAAAVVWGQSDAVLALHFGFSLLSFASVALLAVYISQASRTEDRRLRTVPVSQRFRYAVWGLAVYTYLVVYTGAYVRHTGSMMGCGNSWPFCGDRLLPDFFSQAGIQLLHRYASGLCLLFTVWLLWAIIRLYRKQPEQYRDLYKAGWIALVLLILQALSGAAVVWTNVQLILALLHATFVCAYFTALSYLCMRVGFPRQREESHPERIGDPATSLH
jgi:heme a synthase